MTRQEREFWMEVYVASIQAGHDSQFKTLTEKATILANEAVHMYREKKRLDTET